MVQVRDFEAGMGRAVAERTILRRRLDDDEISSINYKLEVNPADPFAGIWTSAADASGVPIVTSADFPFKGRKPVVRWETWGEVSHRVALGNASLRHADMDISYNELYGAISKATVVMSGRHLQHGDHTQPDRSMERYTNCVDYSTRILTLEHGPTEIGPLSGQQVTVIAGDGVPRVATINSHGEQQVNRVTFRNLRTAHLKTLVSVDVTANHRWPLRDGSITTDLKVGDILKASTPLTVRDPVGIVHGLIFGDGSAHKGVRRHGRPGISQGRTYATLRVCKRGSVAGEIHTILDSAGYGYTTPPHSDGDRVYYIGKFAHAKELPFTTDPEYIAGFIYGWWLADGSKNGELSLEISTSDAGAATWLTEHGGYAGYSMIMHRTIERDATDGSYPNGKALHVIRLRHSVEWKAHSIEPVGIREVFCPEEPVTGQFVLANGLLTGNCSVAPTTFLVFRLLLSGSGVGRDYSSHMIAINFDYAPNLRCVLDEAHPDFTLGAAYEGRREAIHKYGEKNTNSSVVWFEVPDSREGWAQAIEAWEVMAFQKGYRNHTMVLDFSGVRERGKPIKGMQYRPSSGPIPLMNSLIRAATLKGAGIPPWKQALLLDHLVAECVLVGGARRSARMATMHWRDKAVLEFIQVKRPIEYNHFDATDVAVYREVLKNEGKPVPGSFLWSANNSVLFDEEAWQLIALKPGEPLYDSASARWARKVFNTIVECAYGDGTGEPGIINVDKLVHNQDGWEAIADGSYAGDDIYPIEGETKRLMADLAQRALNSPYSMITNPCQPSWAPVLTPDGISTMGDVKIGDRLWSKDGWVKVVEKRANGVKPVYWYRTNAGAFVGTDNHRVVSSGIKVEAGEAESIDVLAGPPSPVERLPQFVMDGLVIGDGTAHRTSHDKVYLTIGDDDLDYFTSEVGHLILGHHPAKKEKAYKIDTSVGEDELPPLPGRVIPDRFLYGTVSQAASFLRGLFSANGSVVGNRVTLKTTSSGLASQAQWMLSSLGIVSYLTTNKASSVRWSNGEYTSRPSYDININSHNALVFAEKIGFIQGYKNTKLSELSRCDGPRGNRVKTTFDIAECYLIGEEEVFDITVDGPSHTYWSGGHDVSNCGEIALSVLGGFCVLCDVIPFHADTIGEAEEAMRIATRALIRVNTMPSVYKKEVQRTNRIGVGMTGIFEFAAKFFGVGFNALVNPNFCDPECKSAQFWRTLSIFAYAVEDEARKYSAELGLPDPHTSRTIKPSGTISKLWGLSEGAHLPSMKRYIRWVQFRSDDPLVAEYQGKGYPTRDLVTYAGTTIVGFPTEPTLTALLPDDTIVTAGEASPEDQYKWLSLLEHFWLRGDIDGEMFPVDHGNQISFTLKYNPAKTSLDELKAMLRWHQPRIKACSVMPVSGEGVYEYYPEEAIDRVRFEETVRRIGSGMQEDVDERHVVCAGGACPIDFNRGEK